MRTPLLRLAAVAALLLPTQALAHAGISPSEAALGSTVKVAITVPHGCDGAPVDAVDITLPAGFVLAKPQPKAGWTVEIIKGDYAMPADDHGTPVTSGALAVRWSGGSLPDDQFDEFAVRGSVQGVEGGASLAFVVAQHCGDATVVWDQLAAHGQDAHALEHPAPALLVTAGGGEHDHDMAPAVTTVGDLEISGAFTRATLPNAPVGGGYLTISNKGTADDRLVSMSSDVAGSTQVHEMKMDGDVMKMTELPDGLVIPAGGTISLEPGGYHIMFMDLKQAFIEGESVAVTLTFEKAGSVEVQLPVGTINADEPSHDMMGM
jgi:uncharacterized protein YcnI